MSKRSTPNHRPKPVASRVIGLAVVLALISLQQAWAAALCACDHSNQPQTAVSHCNRHEAAPADQSDTAMQTRAGMDHAGLHHHSVSAMQTRTGMQQETNGDKCETLQSERGCTIADGQSSGSLPIAFSCCQTQSKADLPALYFSSQQEPLELEGGPLQLDSAPPLAPASLNLFKPPRSRPVYLTVSSLLI